ncbi:hypothetical protein [Mesorhizobium marinum]|uniref:DUF4279 domain-containing protein n=1 Tax=Mesorhizobium marinum TaxID=3228790 RepID=A0ABV3QZJ2_9HYPH
MIGTMAFDYQVSLQVYHPDADPADIVDGIAIQASRSCKVGDRRSAPNGADLSGHYHETYCLFRLGGGNDGKLAKCLRDAVKILQPKRQYLDWLRETGGRMNFYVGWTVGERGEVFDTRLLSEIAQLGIDLGIEPFRVRQRSASHHI